MDLSRPSRAGALVATALLVVAACTDRSSPVTPTPPPGSGPGGPSLMVQALQCTGSLQALTVSCGAARPGPGASGDLIVGNQNVYVKVATSAIAYNGATGVFTFSTTVQNLLEQPMGTTDGTTVAPGGINIFFSTGPAVTSGTGTAAVVPDGFATFTAAGQAYYRYVEKLTTGQTSAAHTWTLIMPPTVTTFDFILFVSAPVEYPNGYITLDGQLPDYSFGNLHPAAPHALTAVVKTAVGSIIPGAVVTYGTSSPACATVDAAGTVTGVQAASCTITATSGIITGSMKFDVTGAIRTWTGAVSSDWSVGGNWGLGLVPAATDSVDIPAGVPNMPALSASSAIGGVTVQNGATLGLGAFNLTAGSSVATVGTGAITSTTGQLVLAGGSPSTLVGNMPVMLVTGTYALAGDVNAAAPAQVENGFLNAGIYSIHVQ